METTSKPEGIKINQTQGRSPRVKDQVVRQTSSHQIKDVKEVKGYD